MSENRSPGKLEADFVKETMEFLLQLENILKKRKQDLPDKSYTADLFRGGVDRILKKVGEEAGEVIIAAKNSDKKELTHEAADLLFHLQVLLVEQELSLQDVVEELRKRHS
ncbi:phosphoribosyl-ATP diphosphatase [Leptospira borgpetersenii serovar Hardjo-bovis str. Sponselee]|nr:phosphoribosyl-ATP diphosphatase [Leptospira borgpetersenii serovar Ballum]EKP14160.1 phosphoribosyl-ATP diphosphatase [Leptospira borgpetersenii str. 200801926]EMF99956.1 phosphoribosyl-ATP diphosphatase [Leptospira borgpetersenii str. 200701203]EMJ82713.1 phosphoribosyl-ATP diphosphatase [Leptospira borgpetersenii serovar Hardjo-bovis str. Sponselee]EMN18937.1 phosphoribosyl-ATP diphosphatase [Leptospira borgpetersenii str. Brem 328]EMO11974.1 phosphoribosyl-ATP diphosphatase [Leptospira 